MRDMTLRELGQFFLELGKEFLDTFLWDANWLDANIFVVILVCITYCFTGVILFVSLQRFLTEQLPELVTSGLIKLPLLAEYLMRLIFILIVLTALAPTPYFLLVNIVSRESMGLIHIAWATILIYGFIWKNVGGKLWALSRNLVLKIKPVRRLFRPEQ